MSTGLEVQRPRSKYGPSTSSACPHSLEDIELHCPHLQSEDSVLYMGKIMKSKVVMPDTQDNMLHLNKGTM